MSGKGGHAPPDSRRRDKVPARLAPAADRTAFIKLREARDRWKADDEPIAVFELATATIGGEEAAIVRGLSAAHDRSLKLRRLARHAGWVSREVKDATIAAARQHLAIDLRDTTVRAERQHRVVEREAVAASVSESLRGVVSTIRQLTLLRDEGLLTAHEFETKMAEVLERV